MSTAAIASASLGTIMICVIVISNVVRINPDNVATPIAASLGDLVTLGLLSAFAKWLYDIGGEEGGRVREGGREGGREESGVGQRRGDLG